MIQGIMTVRDRQKEKTEKILLKSAHGLFALNGILNTPTKKIAENANISHGTLFAHFSTRDILISAVIEKFLGRITDELHQLIQRNSSIEEVLTAHLGCIGSQELFYTRVIQENKVLPKHSQATLVIINSSISFYFLQAIEKKTGHYKINNLPVHFIFNSWIGLIHYYLINKDLFAPKSSVLKIHGDDLIKNFLQMLNIV